MKISKIAIVLPGLPLPTSARAETPAGVLARNSVAAMQNSPFIQFVMQ